MGFIRFLGRSLFSSLFVADGVKLFLDSQASNACVDAAVDKIVPAAQKVLPESVAAAIPENRSSWARILAGVEIVGGLSYATGIGRRFGACLLALSCVPKVLGSIDDEKQDTTDLLTNLGLLGAAVVATRDLQGNPSFSWRTEQVRRRLAKDSKDFSVELLQAGKDGGRKAQKALKKAQKQAKKYAHRQVKKAHKALDV